MSNAVVVPDTDKGLVTIPELVLTPVPSAFKQVLITRKARPRTEKHRRKTYANVLHVQNLPNKSGFHCQESSGESTRFSC